MYYIVKENDTLYSIASKFNTTVNSLIFLNRLQNTILTVGQKLLIYEEDSEMIEDYQTYDEFMDKNKGRGFLKIQVYMARGILPVQDTLIRVSKMIGEEKIIFFEGVTNESGMVNSITLPTILHEEKNPRMTNYIVEAIHRNYIQKHPRVASIYDQIKSILTIEMVPAGRDL